MYGTSISRRARLMSGAAVAAVVVFSGTASLGAGHSVWTGYYYGAHVGSGFTTFVTTDLHDNDGDFVITNPAGTLVGAQAGYNWQMGSFVLGMEADVSLVDWNDSKYFPGSSRQALHSVGTLGSVRGRIGMPFDQALVYATAGLAFADANYTSISPSGTVNAGVHNKSGSVVGLGAEFMLPSQTMSIKVEGLYYNFNDLDVFAGSENPSGSSRFDNAYSFQIGVNYRFSDARLKRDIVKVSELANGLSLYRYRYIWSDRVYVGVLAHEVLEVLPEAVATDEHGFMRVDYDQLGIRPVTFDEWTKISSFALAA